MISDHVSLAVAALQQVDAPARERIRAHAIAKVNAYEKDGQVRVPGVARCIVGTKRIRSEVTPKCGENEKRDPFRGPSREIRRRPTLPGESPPKYHRRWWA